MIALTTYGGACWWANRLTPDELVIVGRWEVVYGSVGSSQTYKAVVDYHRNRTTYTDGMMGCWKADNGLIHYENDHPFVEIVSGMAGRVLGLGIKQQDDIARYEIINHNKIVVDAEIGMAQVRFVWTRIDD